MLRVVFLCLSLSICLFAVEDPYERWGHGRPQDAIPTLYERARTSDAWDQWLDLGLAAAAAERSADAIAWILHAHVRAPERAEPLQALQALERHVPAGWLERLGPLAWPGLGWVGVLLLGVGGAGCAFACCAPRWRGAALGVGAIALLAALPGRIAYEHDRDRPLLSTVRDSVLLDSAGRPLSDVAAGTILTQREVGMWGGRVQVELPDGKRGYLPENDTRPQP